MFREKRCVDDDRSSMQAKLNPVYVVVKGLLPYNELMDEQDRRLYEAIENTHVIRPPRQALATFGTTMVRYYLVTAPSYQDLDVPYGAEEAVIREGVVRAERPQVVTPYYLLRHEGFGENAERYLQNLIDEFGPDQAGLMYRYKNEGAETSIVTGSVSDVTQKIIDRLDREEKPLEAVIRGSDDLWDASLMKFIYELTSQSARANVSEMHSRGLLQMDGGVPREARQRIEWMLQEARRGNLEPAEVHRELERWDLFDEYQDRFLKLFG